MAEREAHTSPPSLFLNVNLTSFLTWLNYSLYYSVVIDFGIYVIFDGDTARAATWEAAAAACRALFRFWMGPTHGAMCDIIGRKKFLLCGLAVSTVTIACGVMVPTPAVLILAATVNGIIQNTDIPFSLMIVEICRVGRLSAAKSSGTAELEGGSKRPSRPSWRPSEDTDRLTIAFSKYSIWVMLGTLLGMALGTAMYQALDNASDLLAHNLTNTNETLYAANDDPVVCGNDLLGDVNDENITYDEERFPLPPLVDKTYYPTKLIAPVWAGVCMGIVSQVVGVMCVQETVSWAATDRASPLKKLNPFPTLAILFRTKLSTCFSATLLMLAIGQVGLISTLPFYASYKFGARPVEQASLLFLVISTALLSNAVVFPLLQKMGLQWQHMGFLTATGASIMAIGACFSTSMTALYLSISIPNVCAGYAVALFKGLLSDLFPPEMQSSLQAAISSARTFGGIFTPLMFLNAFAWGVRAVEDDNDCNKTANNWKAGAPFLLMILTASVGIALMIYAKRLQVAAESAVVPR